MSRSPRLLAPIAAVALVYAATLALLPAGGLWIVDNGAKRIQVEALAANGFRDFSLTWPGRVLDPELAFNPLPSPFSVVREGRLYSVFSPVLPALSVLPFRTLGDWGLCLLPLLATLVLLASLGRLATLADLPARGGALTIGIAGLATPLWFYAVIFWEHAIAASLCVGSVALALGFLEHGSRRQLWLSGLAIALAAAFRDSLLLFVPVLGALVCLSTKPQERLRSGSIFAAGLAAGLLPLELFQWLALGNPLGFHLTHGFAARAGEDGGLGFHLRTRPAVLYNLLLAASGHRGLSLLITGPMAFLLLAQPRLPDRAHRAVVLGVSAWALALSIVVAIGYATARSPIEQLLVSNGFFAAAPLLVVGLVRRREYRPSSPSDRIVARLLHLALGYALLYSALTPVHNTTGIHWGNRYLLELYPLLTVPCAAGLVALSRSGAPARAAIALLALLAIASVALQILSIDLLRRKLVFGERLERAVHEGPETVVVSDQWWVPQTLAREFFDKPIFYVPTRYKARALLERLANRGIRRFLYVTKDREQPPLTGSQVIEDEGLGFFSLRLEHRSLGADRREPGSLPDLGPTPDQPRGPMQQN